MRLAAQRHDCAYRTNTHLLDGLRGFRWRHVFIDQFHLVGKLLAVFRPLNGVDRSTQYLDAVLLEHAAATQSDAAVEARLTAECQQDAVRALAFYHLQMKHSFIEYMLLDIKHCRYRLNMTIKIDYFHCLKVAVFSQKACYFFR